MAPSDKAGRVVFIGNIPYGISEEQIVDTLSRVGHVLNFRLIHDKETGRPKGFGFAEFADGDAAASAVRNLNDYEIMGRKLRVDWSNDNGDGDSAPTTYAPPAPPAGHPEPAAIHQQSTTLPPLPPGTDPPTGLTCADAISRTLATLPPEQLLDILKQMKSLVMTDPAKAVELLTQAPQLAYALFQALLILNLVDATALAQVIEAAPGGRPAAAAPPAAPVPQPQPAFPGYAPQPTPTPSMLAQPAYPTYGQLPPMHPALASATPEQRQQYLQLKYLTMDQINALEPVARQQILELRANIEALEKAGYKF
ncbi:uncharacterized protein EI97DRAFT_471247 [Westerdykella ornata]|uniref:RRM domain-containing protein n=1 Tax=Westerdykella ornata TaxID=318751 RepID=A0A6A6J5F7_WESOR|nr:uncharacterized protein EI97DRAFT_471247 [Westerdykella ornata]KAF2271373.1 hypothetical protein EI97DRAFT_471247 [Westerdykella ornata]